MSSGSRCAAVMVCVAASLALPGCAIDRFSFDFGRPEPVTEGRSETGEPKPFDMAGRWTLTAGRGTCALTLASEAAGATSGTVAPESGCPGRFFASKNWAFESTGLVIRDFRGEPLASLSMTDGGEQFNGKAMTGETVTLVR